MKNTFNEFVNLIRAEGMIYFKDNSQELERWIKQLEPLNNINTSAQCKFIYYTVSELLETISEQENDNIDMDIYSLQSRFFDYVGIVQTQLK